jgi:hypothetical protein
MKTQTPGPYLLEKCPEGYVVRGKYGVIVAYFGTSSIFHFHPRESYKISMDEAKCNAERFLTALEINP